IPKDTRPIEFPANREGFIDLNGLAGLDALAAEDALAGIIAVEGIRHIHFVWLGGKWSLLVLDPEGHCRVVDAAVLVVVIADRAIEQVVAEDRVEGLRARIHGTFGFGDNLHTGADLRAAGADQ